MRVLHVSFCDYPGGAGIAAASIHKALLSEEVDSRFLCCRKKRGTLMAEVHGGMVRRKVNAVQNRLIQKVMRLTGCPSDTSSRSLNLFPSGLHHIINRSDADVVHLHWINGEALSIAEIGKITKPVIWTLHDMWPFCGSEHQVLNTENARFQVGYTTENRSKGSKGVDWDQWVWSRKKVRWKDFKPHLIAVSNWMKEMASTSVLFGELPISVIHNPIDTAKFKPFLKLQARKELNLPPDKKIVLFCGGEHKNKGTDLIHDIAREAVACSRENIIFLSLGQVEESLERTDGAEFIHLGQIQDVETLAKVYSAADLYLSCSRQESFGLSAAESMACGTPVVCYRTSGLKDVVEHKVSGYLVESYLSLDFTKGLQWVFHQDGELGKNARERCVRLFSPDVIALQYLSVYQQKISKGEGRSYAG